MLLKTPPLHLRDSEGPLFICTVALVLQKAPFCFAECKRDLGAPFVHFLSAGF
jgi:hypothetical protein